MTSSPQQNDTSPSIGDDVMSAFQSLLQRACKRRRISKLGRKVVLVGRLFDVAVKTKEDVCRVGIDNNNDGPIPFSR